VTLQQRGINNMKLLDEKLLDYYKVAFESDMGMLKVDALTLTFFASKILRDDGINHMLVEGLVTNSQTNEVIPHHKWIVLGTGDIIDAGGQDLYNTRETFYVGKPKAHLNYAPGVESVHYDSESINFLYEEYSQL